MPLLRHCIKVEIKILHPIIDQIVSLSWCAKCWNTLLRIISYTIINQSNFYIWETWISSFSFMYYPTYLGYGGLNFCIGFNLGTWVDVVYLDLLQAFDRVPHASYRLVSNVRVKWSLWKIVTVTMEWRFSIQQKTVSVFEELLFRLGGQI